MLASLPATPGAARDAGAGRWVTLEGAAPSLLQAPASCAARGCPLVVVSHPRGQGPERLRDSPQVQTLAQALLRANFAVLLSSDGGRSAGAVRRGWPRPARRTPPPSAAFSGVAARTRWA
ncbi:hypothetical protein ACFQDE_02435 [Deinococcus caeni]|uniref:hypothetical protein n=1 Tax=Deinococcus caeni TaxID=569127 RepID=UPI00360F59A4